MMAWLTSSVYGVNSPIRSVPKARNASMYASVDVVAGMPVASRISRTSSRSWSGAQPRARGAVPGNDVHVRRRQQPGRLAHDGGIELPVRGVVQGDPGDRNPGEVDGDVVRSPRMR